MYLLYFLLAFTTGLNSPFSKVIQTQFVLSTFESQFGNLAFFIAYFFMGIPASMIINKVGYKKGTQYAIATLILGIGIVFTGGNLGEIWLYLAGMFVVGCGITIVQIVVNPMIASLGSAQGANSRMNFGGAAFAIGGMLAPVVAGFIIGNAVIETLSVSDVNPLLYTMIGLALMVFIIISLVQFPETGIRQVGNEEKNYSVLLNPKFIIGIIAVFLYVGVEVATGTISFLYMTNYTEGGLSINPEIAGFVVSFYSITMLIGRLLGGIIGKKVSSRPQLIAAAACSLIMYLIGIFLPETFTIDISFGTFLATVPINVLLFVGIGLFTSVLWTCIFIIATEGLGKQTNIASGIFIMMVCGGGIVPVIQGKLVDLFGFVNSYWAGVFCLAFILIYAIFIAKNKTIK